MRIAACSLLILAAATASGADIYRSTGADGVVRFSDRPEGNAEPVHIASARVTRTPVPRPAAAAAAATAPAEDPNRGVQADNSPTPAELAELKTKNCTVARERQASYSTAHRLYRELPNGEREYLSDSDIDKARAQSEADIKTWCG